MSGLVAENKLVSVAYTIRDVNGSIVEHNDLPISYAVSYTHLTLPTKA